MSSNFYWMSALLYGSALVGILLHDKHMKKDPDAGEMAYRRLLSWVIVFCAVDVFWGLCASHVINNDTVFWIASTLFHSATVLTTYVWLWYVVQFFGDTLDYSKIYLSIGKLLIAVQACLLLANCFTPVIFHIADGLYVTDFLRPVAFSNQYVVYLMMFCVAGIKASCQDVETCKRSLAVVCFAIVPVILGVFQLFFPEDPYYSIGYAFGCFIIHMFVVSRDRENLLIIQRNIEKREAERRLAEQIIISNTDELTGIKNRRAYEKVMRGMEGQTLPDKLVYVAADVNGLKNVNDTKGHLAGDEMIRAAAGCLQEGFSGYGEIYRTGGDEFVAIIEADEEELASIKAKVEKLISNWQGELVKELAISFGYASVKELPGLAVIMLAQIADDRMYQNKTQYYISRGLERRGQKVAYAELCATYTKILQIDLNHDTFKIVYALDDELTETKGYNESFYTWLHDFGVSGMVHKDDIETFLAKTSAENLKRYFQSGMKDISVHYRRLTGNVFRRVKMEFVRAEDYTDARQIVYLYVKDID